MPRPLALAIALALAGVTAAHPTATIAPWCSTLAWLAGAGATAVVPWRDRGARLASVALALAAVTLAESHVPPFGPVAMLLVAAAVLLSRATPASAPAPAPGPA